MKEVLGSLPEVITAYKNYNLLVPTATDVQLNPFYKFHVEEVPVDLGENSGDIFKVGSVKTGKQDEKGKCGKKLTDPESIKRGYGPECWNSLTAHYYRSPVDWENYRVPGQMNIEDFLDMGGGDNGDKKDMP